MNPVVSAAIGSVLRWLLAGLAGYFVQRGVWTDAHAEIYVAAAVTGLLSLGWSLWQKYHGRLTLLTALTLAPGATEADAKRLVKRGHTPAVTTPETVAPARPPIIGGMTDEELLERLLILVRERRAVR